MAAAALRESRTGRNVQHRLVPLLRQSVDSRLAGYEDTNDAERLAQDPAMRVVVGWREGNRAAASTNTMRRVETETPTTPENLEGLKKLNAVWVSRAVARPPHRRVILDPDRSESEVHGEQEGAAYTGHFGCTCDHPLFLVNQFGDCAGTPLRPGDVHSADRWREVLEPAVQRYRAQRVRVLFRGDAAFANPEVYESLEAEEVGHAIRLPSNEVLAGHIRHLFQQPEGALPEKPIGRYHDLLYPAGGGDRPRRVVARVEWPRGELLPRWGVSVTNLDYPVKGISRFYNGRGPAERWIEEGKQALTWTRLSCHRFVANQGRLWLFLLAYNRSEGLVAGRRAGEANQEGRAAGAPRPKAGLPACRGGCASGAVPGEAGAHREVMSGARLAERRF